MSQSAVRARRSAGKSSSSQNRLFQAISRARPSKTLSPSPIFSSVLWSSALCRFNRASLRRRWAAANWARRSARSASQASAATVEANSAKAKTEAARLLDHRCRISGRVCAADTISGKPGTRRNTLIPSAPSPPAAGPSRPAGFVEAAASNAGAKLGTCPTVRHSWGSPAIRIPSPRNNAMLVLPVVAIARNRSAKPLIGITAAITPTTAPRRINGRLSVIDQAPPGPSRCGAPMNSAGAAPARWTVKKARPA